MRPRLSVVACAILLSGLGLLVGFVPLQGWGSATNLSYQFLASNSVGARLRDNAPTSSAAAAACVWAIGNVHGEEVKEERGPGGSGSYGVYGADLERNLTGFQAPTNVSLHEAFFSRRASLPIAGLPQLEVGNSSNFTTRFLPNGNAFDHYPLFSVENMCVEPVPAGEKFRYRWVVVNAEAPDGMAQQEQEFQRMWKLVYNLPEEKVAGIKANALAGVRTARTLDGPSVRWVGGNTLHYHTYGGNTMHNWAERVWPQIARFSPPLNETTPHPVHHFLISDFDYYFQRADANLPNQVLWQARMLMELAPGADHLLLDGLQSMACFERLLLQPYDLDRADYTRLPPEVSGPAVRKYRDAVYNFFGLPSPQVRLPPEKLKVVYYGRRDVSRRRVVNGDEVMAYLRNLSRPQMEVYCLDDMLADKVTSYAFQDILSLHSQTDIWIVAHGANTWASFLLPVGAAVIELFGPCHWSPYSPNRFYRHLPDGTGQAEVHTWTHINSLAAQLKHDLSNPWLKAVPQPGVNNTECTHPRYGTPDYTIDTQRLGQIIQHLGWPAWPGDRFTCHWLYDWTQSPTRTQY